MEVTNSLIPLDRIEDCILFLRGQKVMLDRDLAKLYGVSTKVLNQAVKRNRKRFPEDFLFQLTKEEKVEVVTICDHLKSIKYFKGLPFAFTEHGALMASMVLNSERATEMSVYVIRAFTNMSRFLGRQRALATKLSQLEQRVSDHDEDIKMLVETIRRLMEPPRSKIKRIGF